MSTSNSRALLIGAASASSGGAAAEYEIERSLRFNSADTAYLNRTPESAGNRKTWTWSGWIKRSKISDSVDTQFFSAGTSGASNLDAIGFTTADTLLFYSYNGSYVYFYRTSAVFRDPSAWYHVVAVLDTTNATSTDRVRLYINGVRVTDFITSTAPSQNADGAHINTTNAHYTGKFIDLSRYFNGYLADVHFLDGLTPGTTTRVVNGVTEEILTDFGEFDATTGVWNPIEYTGSHGTNGFHLPFSNNSSTIDLGTDTSVTVSDAVANKGMDIVTYTGNGSTQTINSLRFAPDFIWIKCRSNGTNHVLQDTVRGITNKLASNGTYAENDGTQLGAGDGYVSAVTSNGFTVTNGSQTNQSSQTYVGWCWKAGGTPVTNTNGSINSQVSANQDYGFSIVTWAGNSTAGSTIGHGLSAAPSLIIVKNRSISENWPVYVGSLGGTKALYLDLSLGEQTSSQFWNNTSTTSSVFSVGSNTLTNNSGNNYVAYCWSEIAGFSKFGTYTGNGSSTGPVVTTGFKVRYLLVKHADGAGNWILHDTARNPSNPSTKHLRPNTDGGEDTGASEYVDLLDDGFQLKGSGDNINKLNSDYIYAAFAGEPGNNWAVNNFAVSSTFNGVALDGVDDYLQLTSSEIAVGSGDFTIEAYVNVGSRPADNHNIFSYRGAGGSATGFNLAVLETSRGLALYSNSSIFSGGNVPVNQWTHVAISRSSNTLKGFVNGVQFASVTNSTDFSNSTLAIGSAVGGAQSDLQGFISNFRMVKGTGLYTSNFAPPTAPLTNVTNTKLLCCQSSTSTTEAAVTPVALTANGDIYAGTFTDNFAENDSLRDSPTNGNTADDTGAGGEVPGNYCTANPLIIQGSGNSFANGNLDVTVTQNAAALTTISFDISTATGFYAECLMNTVSANGPFVGIRRADITSQAQWYIGYGAYDYGYAVHNGNKYNNSSSSSYGSTLTAGDILQIAVKDGKIWWGKNGTWFSSGDPAAGTNAAYTGITGNYLFGFSNSAASTVACSWNFGQRAFAYAAPSGFQPLATPFLNDPTIADGSAYMDVALYTGNGGTKTISGLGFSPDLMWIKNRNSTYHHALYDTIRGATKMLSSSEAAAEITYSSVTSQTAGFEISGAESRVNENNLTYAAWTWDAGSSTVSNTDGSITSQVRANASAGFSIVGHTGTGSAGTVGHGLNVAPEFIIHKNRDSSNIWVVYHKDLGNNYGLKLNTTDAKFGPTDNFNYTSPTSTVFSVGPTNGNNESTKNIITYCFAPIEGYSAFGSYTGNGSSDGPFVYTGFRPRWVMMKNSTTGGAYYDWRILDVSRHPYNGGAANADFPPTLFANTSGAEVAWDNIDILSNGFKIKDSSNSLNANGSVNIYAAFAENPFKYARAR